MAEKDHAQMPRTCNGAMILVVVEASKIFRNGLSESKARLIGAKRECRTREARPMTAQLTGGEGGLSGCSAGRQPASTRSLDSKAASNVNS